MEGKAEETVNTVNIGPSTSQGRIHHFPTYRGGYLSSDEETDYQADTNEAEKMLEGVKLQENSKLTQDVRSHGDAPVLSDESDEETSSNYVQRIATTSRMTVGPVKNIGIRETTRQISCEIMEAEDNRSDGPKEKNSDEPVTRTSTLERITKGVKKHFKTKSFKIPYNLRNRANLKKTSKQIKKSADTVVKKGRSMLSAPSKFIPQFFKKN